MRSVLISACAFACLLVSTAQAVAAPYSVTVTYSATDLTTEAGVSAVYEKIAAAAEKVCKPDALRPLDQAAAFKAECRKQTLANTVATLNAPALNAYYEAMLHPSRNAATTSETLAAR